MIERPVAVVRARLLSAIRGFFSRERHLEVDTPNLATALIPEAHIPVFETTLIHPWESGEPRYLIPSPEVHMKRLLARGFGSIYRLGPSFRNAEIRSRIHNPEFTMLEWYTVDADYHDSLGRTRRLLEQVGRTPWEAPDSTVGSVAPPDTTAPPRPPSWLGVEPEVLTVEDALSRFAGAPAGVFDREDGIRETARRAGLRVSAGESDEDLFQRVLLSRVEPALPTDRPVFLIDYPSFVPSLARQHDERPVISERWELYIDGMEVANCYTEERDPNRLQAYLQSQSQALADSQSGPFAPPDESLPAFSRAPACSGVALGVDRLLMALIGSRDIQGVIFTG